MTLRAFCSWVQDLIEGRPCKEHAIWSLAELALLFSTSISPRHPLLFLAHAQGQSKGFEEKLLRRLYS